MRKLIIFVLLILFALACKKFQKEPSLVIEGIVIDRCTNLPAADYPVELDFIAGNQGVGLNLGSYTIDKVMTDKKGVFKFKLYKNHGTVPEDVYRINSIGNPAFFEIQDVGLQAVEADKNKYIFIKDTFNTYQKILGTIKIAKIDSLGSDGIIFVRFDVPRARYSMSFVAGRDSFMETYPFLKNYPIPYKKGFFKNGVSYGPYSDTFIFRNENDTLFIEF